MKLLFDQNLSPRLVESLADIYPGSAHGATIGLDRADDGQVWNHARRHEYTLVTKDSDFQELGLLRGAPPKVIWIRRGNCTTRTIEEILRRHAPDIQALSLSLETDCLLLY